MLSGLGVAVLFAQPIVDNIDHVSLLTQAYTKIFRLDVAVQKVFRVHVLDPIYHLVLDHADRLQAELPPAERE